MAFPDSDLQEKYSNVDWSRLQQYQPTSWQAGSAGTFSQNGIFNPSEAAQNFLTQYQKDNPSAESLNIKPLSSLATNDNARRPGVLGYFQYSTPDSVYISESHAPDSQSMTTLVHELQHKTDHDKGSFGFNGKPFHTAIPGRASMMSYENALYNQASDFRKDASTILNHPSVLGAFNSANAELSARLAEKKYLAQQPNPQDNLTKWKQDPWTPGYPISFIDSAYGQITMGKMNPLPVYVDNDYHPVSPKPAPDVPMKLATEAYPYIGTQKHFFAKDVNNRIFADD
jgi:hypothetical protein